MKDRYSKLVWQRSKIQNQTIRLGLSFGLRMRKKERPGLPTCQQPARWWSTAQRRGCHPSSSGQSLLASLPPSFVSVSAVGLPVLCNFSPVKLCSSWPCSFRDRTREIFPFQTDCKTRRIHSKTGQVSKLANDDVNILFHFKSSKVI